MLPEGESMNYSYKSGKALKQNPFIGFTTFQHFLGDPLYSDIIVDPNNNALETEERECYPVPDYIEHNGRNEGFYPDGRVAYIRILWKLYEPERGVYNDELVRDILRRANEKGQTVMFRILPHSTRPEDDVPDWLKKITPCPERPAGKRVKRSPADPVYLKIFGETIRHFAGQFDINPILNMMDISITGAWGEGSYYEEYPTEALEELIDVYTESFNNTHLIGQVAAPELIEYGRKTKPIGWRGDGVGNPWLLTKYYPEKAETLSECWKTAPVSFESYWWLCEWKRLGWSLDDVIEKTLGWHISHFNGKSMPIPFEWKDKIDYWISKMGYHFTLKGLAVSDQAENGLLQLKPTVENTGVAPIYDALPLILRLKNDKNMIEFATAVDITKWMPGVTTEEISMPVNSLSSGEYELGLAIRGGYCEVYLENDIEYSDGFYRLCSVKV